jgi:hypothetical protein
MADDKKLESFKIGDTQKPGIVRGKPSRDEKRQKESEEASLGFRRIETILEEDEAQEVTESLSNLLQMLEELQSRTKSNKDRAAAKKAVVAVERTADLLDYLFQTKTAIQPTG